MLKELLEDEGWGDQFQECQDLEVRVMELMEPAELPAASPTPSVPKMYPVPADVKNSPQYEG